MEHGEYATRGSLIDIFPMGSQVPLRVDVFDDQIESMRADPESQRTITRLASVNATGARIPGGSSGD